MSLLPYRILHSTPADLDFIFQLFDAAIAYQQKHGYNLWPTFSRELIENEIHEKRHWKVCDGDTIACIFSVLYSDPLIWGEKDNDVSIYLHRIAINPDFKGRDMTVVIKNWAIAYAMENQKQFVRMDTWGTNENLRNYYIRCGFEYLGQRHLPKVAGQAPHYGGDVLSLFEVKTEAFERT